ncbi:hypothetical protein F0U59_09130 [Archangium gephyra]|nr:hypothetical protein F0U59_09130 [Archangium gephyra]
MTLMTVDLSPSKLLELVHQYYPVHLWMDADGYGESEQYQRLLRARREAMENSGSWTRLLSKLREALPECSVEDWSVLFSDDNCWRVRVYLPEVVQLEGGVEEFRAVVVLVSILSPVYVRYSSFRRRLRPRSWETPALFYEEVPDTKPYADKVEALVRSELGVQPLPHETLFTQVPDIQCRNTSLGEARLIDCLFTDDRW